MQVTLITSDTSDLSVVNAARVSFDTHHEQLEEGDDKLIGWLLRNRHGSPFEHGYFKFHVEAPIFVFREWHRHRVGHSYNEMSARYVELEDKFYSPDRIRVQSGKPGAYTYGEMENPEIEEHLKRLMKRSFDRAYLDYQRLINAGVAKEQARAVLPVGIYSQMIWSCNPRSLMHFLSLRNAPNAQKEIRLLAEMAEDEFTKLMPITAEAFITNGRVAP